MAVNAQSNDADMVEECTACDRETAHRVSVEIRTESTKTENAEFSREPYRVATCVACGEERTVRMNNA
ncbi:hypothetical protein BRC89_06310 [Halobacteriales archaeon QS_4_70_19]|jgi:ribosomal protein L37AE/L43A|nr:MAG: hypothetical protein BRC89_06310 [Halobacteriales archaeon QS_4_70_19]